MQRHEVSVGVKFYWLRIAGIILGFCFLAAVLAFGAFGLRWQGAALDQIGPERMQQLSREANDRWHGLDAKRSTIMVQQQALATYERDYGVDRSTWPQGKVGEYRQLDKVVTDLLTSYNHECGQYEAMWTDAWRDLPAPDNLPKKCPPLN